MSTRLKTAAASLLLVSLTACGGASAGGESSADGGETAVTVASLAVAQTAPIEIAARNGYFKAEGLNVKIQYVAPTAAIPSVLGGQAQFALLNAPAVLVARSNKVPVVAVSGLTAPNPNPADYPIQLVVSATSPIRTPADLKGKTVAVDTLYQLPDLCLRHALRTSGVDPATVKFVEIPFPQMATALKSGKADAANMTEPFVAAARQDGAVREVLPAVTGQDRTWPQGVALSSESYAKSRPKVVSAFARAVAKADAFARANPDEVRKIVPTFTTLSPALAGSIRFPVFDPAFVPSGWQAWAGVLKQEGVIKNDIDVSKAYIPSS